MTMRLLRLVPAQGGVAVLVLLLGATAAGAGAKREAVAPVGGNGALLLGRSGSDALFVLHQGSRRPEVVRGVSVAENHAAAWSPDGRPDRGGH